MNHSFLNLLLNYDVKLSSALEGILFPRQNPSPEQVNAQIESMKQAYLPMLDYLMGELTPIIEMLSTRMHLAGICAEKHNGLLVPSNLTSLPLPHSHQDLLVFNSIKRLNRIYSQCKAIRWILMRDPKTFKLSATMKSFVLKAEPKLQLLHIKWVEFQRMVPATQGLSLPSTFGPVNPAPFVNTKIEAPAPAIAQGYLPLAASSYLSSQVPTLQPMAGVTPLPPSYVALISPQPAPQFQQEARQQPFHSTGAQQPSTSSLVEIDFAPKAEAKEEPTLQAKQEDYFVYETLDLNFSEFDSESSSHSETDAMPWSGNVHQAVSFSSNLVQEEESPIHRHSFSANFEELVSRIGSPGPLDNLFNF